MELLKKKLETALVLGLTINQIIDQFSQDEDLQAERPITIEKIQKCVQHIIDEQKLKYNMNNIGNNVYIELLKFDYLYQQLIQEGAFKDAALIHTQKVKLMQQARLLPNND